MSARFGMGHMAVAASAATTMAQNWWLQSVESFDKRNMHKLSGATDSGLAVWSTAFHEEGTIEPDNTLQDASFDQKVSGLQAGIQWTHELGDGSVSVSPVFSYGDASANPNANVASAKGHVTAYGLNANYKFDKGLYVDASWHAMSMDTDFKTPGTASSATGETDADGDGFNLETGYAYGLKSGLTLVPQVQYSSVDVELDDFSSSDGVYGSPTWAARRRCCAPASRCSRRSRRRTASSRRWPTSTTCTRRTATASCARTASASPTTPRVRVTAPSSASPAATRPGTSPGGSA